MIKGRVLVTGGNRGLGLQTCRELAERGYQVILASRDIERGKAAAADLSGDVEVAELEVASPAAIARLADSIGELFAVVNNAGASFDGFDAEIAAKTLQINFFGAAAVADALAPHVVDGGNIVMVSSGMGSASCLSESLAARFLSPDLSREQLDALMNEYCADIAAGEHERKGWPSNAYSVSKVGLNALTRVFARQHPRLRVTAVCPGWVRTDMGGPRASRDVEEGASGIVWAATRSEGDSGGIYRDGQRVGW